MFNVYVCKWSANPNDGGVRLTEDCIGAQLSEEDADKIARARMVDELRSGRCNEDGYDESGCMFTVELRPVEPLH